MKKVFNLYQIVNVEVCMPSSYDHREWYKDDIKTLVFCGSFDTEEEALEHLKDGFQKFSHNPDNEYTILPVFEKI